MQIDITGLLSDFMSTMLIAALLFWAWGRVCEVWLNVLEKAGNLERRRDKEE